MKYPLSVSIISFNEEDNIGKTLESIGDLASEIVLVDSYSSDKTRDIAKEFGAKVYEEEWKGHIDQKKSALEKCTQAWILSLDCDEVVSKELKRSIMETLDHPDADGYYINRKTYYLGRFLEHTWQPDWKLRLVKRSANPRWGGYNPHDVLTVEGKTKKLQGVLYHYSYRDIEDHFKRLVQYAKIVAGSYYQEGKKFRLYKLLLNPPAAFLKKYILKMGFLDGIRGFLAAISSFVYVFLKYIFLWEIEHKNSP